MSATYNEIEPYAAQWLRNLSDAGHIAPGNVITRSMSAKKSEQEVWGCACPSWTDAQSCMDLRTHGYSPATDEDGNRGDEECMCACHQHEHEEDGAA